MQCSPGRRVSATLIRSRFLASIPCHLVAPLLVLRNRDEVTKEGRDEGEGGDERKRAGAPPRIGNTMHFVSILMYFVSIC